MILSFTTRPWTLLAVFALLGSSFFATACGEEDKDPTDSRYDRPEETFTMIFDEDIDRLIEVGAVIYEGDDPPSIAGVYDRAHRTVEFDDNPDNIGLTMCRNIWTVEETGEEFRYSTSSENYSNCSGGSEGVASYISGEGNCFTLFSASEGERDGCEYSGVGLISGCITEDGIEEHQTAGLALERPGSACASLINNNLISDVGHRTISETTFVERVE